MSFLTQQTVISQQEDDFKILERRISRPLNKKQKKDPPLQTESSATVQHSTNLEENSIATKRSKAHQSSTVHPIVDESQWIDQTEDVQQWTNTTYNTCSELIADVLPKAMKLGVVLVAHRKDVSNLIITTTYYDNLNVID